MKICDCLHHTPPCAVALVRGDKAHGGLCGEVRFYPVGRGTLVEAEISGLPMECSFFALHIHEGRCCTGEAADPFQDAGAHWNLLGTEHPMHTGDLPTLLGNSGYAWGAAYTERFCPAQARGRTVIVHALPDDYKTQPSGGAGEKIGCGVIR